MPDARWFDDSLIIAHTGEEADPDEWVQAREWAEAHYEKARNLARRLGVEVEALQGRWEAARADAKRWWRVVESLKED